ncbi:MAG: isoaspartyl peptidase/L-asparaginase [Sphingobacteriales bacterium]|nr:MAG: isoaspartyl peptidase/L-asparaginase [Sphingobacteriales bacterium]
MKITAFRGFILLVNMVLGFFAGAQQKPVLVIHGGAGTILKSQMTPEREKQYIAALEEALKKGYSILQSGGSSLDAVQSAVMVLEDNPLFNAGKGAVFTNEGKNEMDAAIMNGRNLAAGAVAGVTTIRNPITAARAVMEKSGHVMLVGAGAEKFASMNGITIVDPSYFYTDSRWRSLERMRRDDSLKTQLDHADTGRKASVLYTDPRDQHWKYGTVGAVALDTRGNLAAATSTGGMSNKKFGRVGDAPLIGIGTYANNATCAISCTGWGEYFIRLGMAKTVSDMMEFGKMSLKAAADEMVMKRLPALGKTDNEVADGGLVAVDKNGNITMPFNSAGMYRGYIDKDGRMQVRIYK